MDDATEAAFGKQFVPKKIPLQAPNGLYQTLLLGEMGETLEIKSMTHLYESNYFCLFKMALLNRAASYTCSNSRYAQQFEMRNWNTEFLE